MPTRDTVAGITGGRCSRPTSLAFARAQFHTNVNAVIHCFLVDGTAGGVGTDVVFHLKTVDAFGVPDLYIDTPSMQRQWSKSATTGFTATPTPTHSSIAAVGVVFVVTILPTGGHTSAPASDLWCIFHQQR